MSWPRYHGKKPVMTIANRYIRRSRISEAKFREFVKCFSLDLDARQTALLTVWTEIRWMLFVSHQNQDCRILRASSPFQREAKADDSCFRAKRIEGIQAKARMAKLRSSVFCSKAACSTRNRSRRAKQTFSGRYPWEGWGWKRDSFRLLRGYHGLVDLAYKRHYRVPYGNNELANGKVRSAASNPFGPIAKGSWWNSMHPKTTFYFIWKSLNSDSIIGTDIYQLVLKMLRQIPSASPAPNVFPFISHLYSSNSVGSFTFLLILKGIWNITDDISDSYKQHKVAPLLLNI